MKHQKKKGKEIKSIEKERSASKPLKAFEKKKICFYDRKVFLIRKKTMM
jgi:hypothetical protein